MGCFIRGVGLCILIGGLHRRQYLGFIEEPDLAGRLFAARTEHPVAPQHELFIRLVPQTEAVAMPVERL